MDDNEPDTKPDEAPATEETATDSSVYEAKIAELTAAIAAKDAEIAELNAAVTAAKAANYDLLTSIPGEVEPVADIDEDSDTDIDDLFGEDDD